MDTQAMLIAAIVALFSALGVLAKIILNLLLDQNKELRERIAKYEEAMVKKDRELNQAKLLAVRRSQEDEDTTR